MKACIKSTILLVLRSPKYFIFSMLFPIFLTILIGGVLGKYFNTSSNMKESEVYYINNIGDEGSDIIDNLVKASDNGGTKLTFQTISSADEGKEKVREDDDIFIELNKDKINVFVQSGSDFHYSYINSLLSGITSRGEAIKLMYSINPVEATNILKNDSYDSKDSSIDFKLLDSEQAPTSFDYYAIAELTMMLLYLMLFPMSRYFEDKRTGIRERMKILGISDFNYYFGSTIGYFIISFGTTLPSFLFSNFVLKTNWGSNPLLCYAAIQVFALASISIGTVVASFFNDEEKVEGVFQGVVFPVLSFLGGAYLALPDNVGGIFQIITNISPIRWLNRGIMQSIFNNSNKLLISSCAVALIVTAIMAAIMVVSGRRKEWRI
ncbi:ABC transporter permease [Clostridium sardiniense]|uniref:ABC transporter permease n=1 Tax=Clostridium sardiniense TaxID=29369 RepID=UPI001958F4B0|nr:ABC transporter permease [Clostridium sardiniense]MBM7834943.1 ABC-2 type transport system permease protein [Clostridium sardiniense]